LFCTVVVALCALGLCAFYMQYTDTGFNEIVCQNSPISGSSCSTQGVSVFILVLVLALIAIGFVWSKYYGH